MDDTLASVLVTDDNEGQRYAIRRALQQAGFQVIEAVTGAQTLELAQRQPGLILLTMNLPDVDGFELCRRLKADPATAPIPVIQLSPHTAPQQRIAGLRAGADDYLASGASDDELLAKVNVWARVRRAEAGLKRKNAELEQMMSRLHGELKQRTQSVLRDVSLRQQMEGELHQREEELREAQRIARVGNWTWDPKTDAVTWSDELVALAVWDPTVPIPKWAQHQQFFDPESWRRLDEAVHHTLRTGEPYTVDTEARLPDGSKRWFTNRGEAVRDAFGQITHLRGTVQDVTERKLAERALRESEERFRGLVESSHDWIWQIDAERKYTYAGPQCFEILGYQPEEVLGRTPFDLMPAAEAERVERVFAAFEKERKPFRGLENLNLHKDGRHVVFETNGTPVFDAEGHFAGYRGMDRDITERKRAEEALIASERKFSTLFRTTPFALGWNELGGNFVEVNDAFEQLTGYTRGEVIGRSPLELRLWVDPEQRAEVVKRLLAEGRVRDFEHRLRTKSGELRFGVLSSALIEINRQTYMLTTVKDITEQKMAEKALSELSGRLINAQEEERKRIGRELHDNINQRVAMLSVALERLASTQRTSGEKEKVREILADTAALSSEIQALSRQLHSPSLDMLGLAAGIKGFCGELSQRHRVTINFVHSGISSTLPSNAALSLFRVTQEALHNAIKYSGVREFDVDLVGTPEQIKLTIRDAGKGFDVEAAMHSSGLGLVSMRERLAAIGGSISIVSEPMKGTEIHVRLPLNHRTEE